MRERSEEESFRLPGRNCGYFRFSKVLYRWETGPILTGARRVHAHRPILAMFIWAAVGIVLAVLWAVTAIWLVILVLIVAIIFSGGGPAHP
jgi:hypothetical protein